MKMNAQVHRMAMALFAVAAASGCFAQSDGSSEGMPRLRDGGWYHRGDAAHQPGLMLAQGSGPTPTDREIEKLKAEIQQLKDLMATETTRIADLEATMGATQYPSKFSIIGIFDRKVLEANMPAAFKDGESAGLPSMYHNWLCPEPPCAKMAGNLLFTGTSTAPKGWEDTYVATKTFASTLEAREWLFHSREGTFIRKYAKIWFGAAVTDYAQGESIATKSYLKARKVLK